MRLSSLDPRWFQIATLGLLLVTQIVAFDFGATPLQAAFSLIACLLSQFAFSRWSGRALDWRSPLITGLSLSLLLRTHIPALWLLAGVLAIGSKFVLRIRDKHIFNPACFAIVVLLSSGQVWVSPGIWGTPLWLAFLLLSLGTMVLTRSARLDIALAFLSFYGGLLLARCLYLDDPMTIPWHQMHSGSLLIFGLFMVTDPRSTPDDRLGRILFAASVAVIAYWLQFRWQIREGLFYALAIVAPVTPLIDLVRPAARFQWRGVEETGSCGSLRA